MNEGENMMNEAIQTLLDNIKADYADWARRCANAQGEAEASGYMKDQLDKWDDLMEVKYGNKYIKIIRENSVWGFVVNTENDKKFKLGDILMAAGWAAPARNAARGNVLDGGYSIRWTGPNYL